MCIKTQDKERLGHSDSIPIPSRLFIPNNFGEHFQKKNNLVQNLIFQIGEALPLGALDYLHVGMNSEESRIKP